MKKTLLKRISVYLTIDENTINKYFNPHDPSPIYKRQLSHEFEQYITSSTLAVKRHTAIRYKLVYSNEADKDYIEPLIHAVRRHFSIQRELKENEFFKFKKRSYKLLFISFAVVMICQGVLPYVIHEEHRAHSALSNALDVFSWVILWKPIEKLIFYWNPFLKELSILDKLTNAEIVTVEKAHA